MFKRLLPKRALVALGLALSFVVSAAAPAQAATTILFPVSPWQPPDIVSSAAGAGFANAYYDNYSGNILEEVASLKNALGDNSDEYSCVETWIDYRLDFHRPADVFTSCNASQYYTGGALTIHRPRSGNFPGSTITYDHLTRYDFNMTVCKVDVRPAYSSTFYQRNNGGNCVSASQGAVGGITHNDYQNRSLQSIDQFYCCAPYPNGADMHPEFLNHGNIDLLGLDTLQPGGLLVAWDGSHRFVMQHNGDLVLYRANNTASWSVSGCLASGHSLIAGSRAVLQSDGNLVVYGPANQVVWASVNVNGCGAGSYGGNGQYLKMQNDGNLVEYYNGGSLWSTGTNGQ